MIEEGFKSRFKYDGTIPFAFYKQQSCPAPITLIPHQHKEIELISMTKGTAEFYIDTALYKLNAGDLLVIPPYCLHRANVRADTSYDCICFDLSLLWDGELTEGLEKGQLTVRGALPSSLTASARLNELVKSAIKVREEQARGWEMSVIGSLSLLFGNLKQMDFFTKSEKPYSEHLFERSVLEYVSEHFSEPVTSNTAAGEMYLNNSYFCRLFKKRFGCCFTEYLLEYRIEKAKFYLQNSRKTISDIASETGFNSFSYFSKMFKRYTGITPTQYIKRS